MIKVTATITEEISLLNTAYKKYAKIFKSRLTAIFEYLLDEDQMGYRKGYSTSDAIFILRQITEKHIENNKKISAFIGLEKAFDNVGRNKLWT